MLGPARIYWSVGKVGYFLFKINQKILRYAESYCFVKGSYFLPQEDEINEFYSQREKIFIGYYQWVPLVLAAQAILFYFPSFVWKAFNFSTGINVKSVLNNAAMVKKKFDKGTRSQQVLKAANHLVEALELQKELKTCKLFFERINLEQKYLKQFFK